jgi:plastocyanin
MVFVQAPIIAIASAIFLISIFLPNVQAVCTTRTSNTTLCLTGPNGNPVCITGPRGATLCAGLSQTVNITKSSYASNMTYGKNADVTIEPNCAWDDIRYDSYLHTCYQPTILYLKPGTWAVWKNDDVWPHTVTSGSPTDQVLQGYYFDSKAIEPGDSYSYQFKYPGAYPYFDEFNWWETGLVIVKK